MVKTFRYRIKDATDGAKLNKLARAVNFVWNLGFFNLNGDRSIFAYFQVVFSYNLSVIDK